MKRVVIESPFRADSWEHCRQHIAYARQCLLDSLNRYEAPYASHLLYTQVWSEDNAFRARGIAAGLEWQAQAELVAFYVDLGWSEGMTQAREACRDSGVMTEVRQLYGGAPTELVRDHLRGVRIDVWPALEALRSC